MVRLSLIYAVYRPVTAVQQSTVECTPGGEELHHQPQPLQSARESRGDNRSPGPAASELCIGWLDYHHSDGHVTRDRLQSWQSWHNIWTTFTNYPSRDLISYLTLYWPAWPHWEIDWCWGQQCSATWVSESLLAWWDSAWWRVVVVVVVTAWLPEEVILLLQVFLSSSNCTDTRPDNILPLDQYFSFFIHQIIFPSLNI